MKFHATDQVKALTYLNHLDTMLRALEARFTAGTVDFETYERELASLIHAKKNLLLVLDAACHYQEKQDKKEAKLEKKSGKQDDSSY